MATRKAAAGKPRVKKCPDCKGKGAVTTPVLVGRRGHKREVAQQDGLCLTCLGSGEAPTT